MNQAGFLCRILCDWLERHKPVQGGAPRYGHRATQCNRCGCHLVSCLGEWRRCECVTAEPVELRPTHGLG